MTHAFTIIKYATSGLAFAPRTAAESGCDARYWMPRVQPKQISSEMATGSRRDNASNKKSKVPLRFNRNEKALVAANLYRPNSRSISQPSSPPAASGRTEARGGAGRPATAAEVAAATLVGDACMIFASKPPAGEPGSATTGTPWWAAFMKRVQTSTGRPPPVALLVGELSSFPSQTPVTRL